MFYRNVCSKALDNFGSYKNGGAENYHKKEMQPYHARGSGNMTTRQPIKLSPEEYCSQHCWRQRYCGEAGINGNDALVAAFDDEMNRRRY